MYDPAVVNPSGKHRPKRRHHGEGSRAFRVKDARRQRPWRCALRIGRDPVTGKLRTKWFSGTSATEAEAARDDYRRRLRRAGSPDAAERTVTALLAGWYAERAPNVDPSTSTRYAGIIRHHLDPTLGPLLVADVTHEDIAAARASWTSARTPAAGKGRIEAPVRALSAVSQNLALGILREAFGAALRRGLTDIDPTAEIARRRKPASTARYLTAEQARALVEALAGDPLELVVKVALAVGPRRGEILGIRWADLDLRAGTWTTGLQVRFMPRTYRKHAAGCAMPGPCVDACEGPYRLVEPKAGHSLGRVISLPAFLIADLTRHRKAQDATRRKAKVWTPNDLVFADAHGQALPPGSVTRRFEQLAERAGLGHLRLHDLRHSSATIMLAMGVPERVVQDILGHASPRQTAAYTHVVRKLGEDAADRMDRAMVARMAASE